MMRHQNNLPSRMQRAKVEFHKVVHKISQRSNVSPYSILDSLSHSLIQLKLKLSSSHTPIQLNLSSSQTLIQFRFDQLKPKIIAQVRLAQSVNPIQSKLDSNWKDNWTSIESSNLIKSLPLHIHKRGSRSR